MSDSPPYPDSNLGTGATAAGSDRGSTSGTPRWVKVFGIVALVVVLLFVILVLTGGGAGHGPSRHAQSDAGVAENAPSVSVGGNIAWQP